MAAQKMKQLWYHWPPIKALPDHLSSDSERLARFSVVSEGASVVRPSQQKSRFHPAPDAAAGERWL